MLTKAYDCEIPTTQHIHNTDYSGHVYGEMFGNTHTYPYICNTDYSGHVYGEMFGNTHTYCIHTYAIHCMGFQHINKLFSSLSLHPSSSLSAISRPADLCRIV